MKNKEEPSIIIGTPEQAVWKEVLEKSTKALSNSKVDVKLQKAVIEMAEKELEDLNLK